jgi:hypothetical protein
MEKLGGFYTGNITERLGDVYIHSITFRLDGVCLGSISMMLGSVCWQCHWQVRNRLYTHHGHVCRQYRRCHGEVGKCI